MWKNWLCSLEATNSLAFEWRKEAKSHNVIILEMFNHSRKIFIFSLENFCLFSGKFFKRIYFAILFPSKAVVNNGVYDKTL